MSSGALLRLKNSYLGPSRARTQMQYAVYIIPRSVIYCITKNFRDKKFSQFSRILEYLEIFFREISGNVHMYMSVDATPFCETFFSQNTAALCFAKVFCREVFSYTVYRYAYTH